MAIPMALTGLALLWLCVRLGGMPLLAITSSGQARLARVIDIQAAAGQRMAGGLTDTDVARFVAIADQMTDALHLGDGAALDG